jgi:hypothetical protein
MALAAALNCDCRAIAIASRRDRDEIIEYLITVAPPDNFTIISIEK